MGREKKGGKKVGRGSPRTRGRGGLKTLKGRGRNESQIRLLVHHRIRASWGTCFGKQGVTRGGRDEPFRGLGKGGVNGK